MLVHAITLIFAVLVWWAGTGLTMLACALPSRTFRWKLAAGTAMLGASVYGLISSAGTTTIVGACTAFLSALGVWAFLEMMFLMGLVTGPRTEPCPPDAEGWHRFRLALATLLWHELSIVGGLALVACLTWGAANQTGFTAFLILAVMRVSAKLNIFLGVPNFADGMLPARLVYLKTYFRRRSFNPLFPISVLGAVLAVVLIAHTGVTSGEAETVATALLCSLLSLAILEHIFMMVPVQDTALWLWAAPANEGKRVVDPAP